MALLLPLPHDEARVTLLAAVLVAALFATAFAGTAVDGVRRWASLGPVKLHVGYLVLPLLAALIAGLGNRMIGNVAAKAVTTAALRAATVYAVLAPFDGEANDVRQRLAADAALAQRLQDVERRAIAPPAVQTNVQRLPQPGQQVVPSAVDAAAALAESNLRGI